MSQAQNDGLGFDPNVAPVNKTEVEREVAAAMNADDEAARIAVAAVDELAEKEAELLRVNQELQHTKDMLTRQVADFTNYRRRMDMDIIRQRQHGKEEVITALLDVFDDMKRSLEAAAKVEETVTAHAGFSALKDGVKMIFENFEKQLTKLGVEAIPAVGTPFSEQFHEALMQQPAPEGTEVGMVLAELQAGYKMGDRVLRHSKVIVSQ